MKIGICMFLTEYTIGVCEFARAVEERGFESLWVPEHTHIPLGAGALLPNGDPLPREYCRIPDPFVTLAAAAAVTNSLLLGTGIAIITERDTISTAKEVASLDQVSNGRFLFGIGAGWNAPEMRNHGTVYETRFEKLPEQVLAMKELWTQEEAQYHGKFVDFDPVWSWPKPVQRPHPPILLGGKTRHTRQRVVDFCDGWMPLAFLSDDLMAEYADLEQRAIRAGRDLDSISVTIWGPQPDRPALEPYAERGFDRVILHLPSTDREKTFRILEKLRLDLGPLMA